MNARYACSCQNFNLKSIECTPSFKLQLPTFLELEFLLLLARQFKCIFTSGQPQLAYFFLKLNFYCPIFCAAQIEPIQFSRVPKFSLYLKAILNLNHFRDYLVLFAIALSSFWYCSKWTQFRCQKFGHLRVSLFSP